MNKEKIWIGTGHSSLRPSATGIRRSQILVAIILGVCCSGGLLLTADSTLNQAGLIDPYLYAGYTNNYIGLLQRFGPNYYADRIAYIFPARAFNYLFGLEGGYLAFRFVTLAAAASSVFVIGLRFYGFAAALLAAVWLSFTPWLPRSLLWTYIDGFTVAYLLIGTAWLVVPTRRRLIGHAVAGAAFALAVNCNIFALAICGLLGPGWMFFYRRERAAWLARAVFVLALGFFAAHLALALIEYVQFPAYGLSLAFNSFRSAILLLNGGGEKWFYPASRLWEFNSFVLLIPVVFALAALLANVRRSADLPFASGRFDFAVFAVSHLAGVIGLSLIFHFGFHDGWLSLPYYRTYFVPGSAFALIVIGGESQRLGGRILGDATVYGGSILLVLLWLLLPILPHLEIESGWPLWLALSGVVAGAAAALQRTAAASMLLVAGVVLLSQCFYDSDKSTYYRIRDRPPEQEAVEWDVYRGALFLQQFVEGYVRPKQTIGFWYSGIEKEPWVLLDSIQATYLWGYTRMFSKGKPGMPLVDDEFRGDIRDKRFVVLLGMSDTETNAGLSALDAAQIRYDEIKRAHFPARKWGYTAVLIQTKPPTEAVGPLLFNIPLVRMELDPMAVNDGSVSQLPDGLQLVTAEKKWTNSLRFRFLPEQTSMRGPAVVRVRLRVEEGEIRVGVSTIGNPNNLIDEMPAYSAPSVEDVYLNLPDLSAAEYLFIRNQSDDGHSRANLYSVDVFRPQ